MKNSTFLTVISSAAAAMAAPTDQKSAARPFVGGPFRSDLSAQRNSPWGGSVQEGNGWRTVTGTTVIPSVTGQSHSAGAAAWVGIDGMSPSPTLPPRFERLASPTNAHTLPIRLQV